MAQPDDSDSDEAGDHAPRDWLQRSRLTRRRALLGGAALAGVAAVDVGGFACAGALFDPDRLTPSRFADRFEQVYGRHDGFRRNHAKGVSATGTFRSTGAGAAICRSPVFAAGETAVTGRFSLSGGLPDQPDKPATVRGLALQFAVPGGGQWRTAMVNIPVFLDSTPEGFADRILASKPQPSTGLPNPAAMAAFLSRHPETVAAMKIVKQSPPTSGFADSTYFGLNAFLMTNAEGATAPVRWKVVPLQTARPAGAADGADPNYLFDSLIVDAKRAPLQWRLVVTVGAPGDPTDDATRPWPADRTSIEAGVITITALHTEAPGNARDVNFDPTVLPDGIARSDDPLLAARSAVYARSYARRTQEPKQPSAVQVEQVDRGI